MLNAESVPLKTSDVHYCGGVAVQFDENDGSIVSLIDTNGRQWAGPSNRIASFHYQTFSLMDFNIFNTQYNPGCRAPCGMPID